MHIKLLQLMQGSDLFWDFGIKVQVGNSLLVNTNSHLDNEKLHHCVKSGMNVKLAFHAHLKKKDSNVLLIAWLNKIKWVDDLMHMERVDFDTIVRAARKNTRNKNTLTEPSRHANNTTITVTNSKSGSNSCVMLPKLTTTKHQLLFDNEGCFKCR